MKISKNKQIEQVKLRLIELNKSLKQTNDCISSEMTNYCEMKTGFKIGEEVNFKPPTYYSHIPNNGTIAYFTLYHFNTIDENITICVRFKCKGSDKYDSILQYDNQVTKLKNAKRK